MILQLQLQLILISALSGPSKHIKCTDEEWKCHNKKQCISYLNFCDFISDCDDGSDEMECKDCYDADKDCTKWVDNGYCLKPNKFIFENCRMSCEICKTSTTTTSVTLTSSTLTSSTVTSSTVTRSTVTSSTVTRSTVTSSTLTISTLLTSTMVTSSIVDNEMKPNNYHKIIESKENKNKNKNKLDKFTIIIIILGSIIIILFIILIIRKQKTNIVYIDKTNRREVLGTVNNSEIVRANNSELLRTTNSREELILNQEYDNIVMGENYIPDQNTNDNYLMPVLNSMDQYYSVIA